MGQYDHKMNIFNKINELSPLVEKLRIEKNREARLSLLLSWLHLQKKIDCLNKEELYQQSREILYIYLSLIAIGEDEQVTDPSLLSPLIKVELFYHEMGGLIGYHLKVLEMLLSYDKPLEAIYYEPPQLFDLQQKNFALSGLKALPDLGEIHLVGGLGDRLKLIDERGEALPAALLPFLGKSLLEILVRDLWAREYLYYKIFKKRFITPLALMTSLEKENESHIRALLEKNNWYGRGSNNFLLFSQILVPVIDTEGRWIFKSEGECLLHPGGHGAIWKAAEEEGVYDWFKGLGKNAFLIRQINNPLAGIDGGLIAFAGCGRETQKTVGIASCERVAHAAEGILLNTQRKDMWTTINIEYTDFQKYGIEDVPDKGGFSRFSTNTNILFVNLEKICSLVKENPIPDCLLNMKTKMGNKLVGRLESLMQNITFFLPGSQRENIETFITYNERSKTISTTKKVFERGGSLLETPEGAFYDLLKENRTLAKACSLQLPKLESGEDYLLKGPSFLFLYHPALGPFYDIIVQKIRGGKIHPGAELQLDIAELYIEELFLEGTLLIEAQDVCGDQPGFCFLKNVSVVNRGIDRDGSSVYWKNEIQRQEKCQIILEENAEFIAENILLEGERVIKVPAHTRIRAYEHLGKVVFNEEKIERAMTWSYSLDQGVKLAFSKTKICSHC